MAILVHKLLSLHAFDLLSITVVIVVVVLLLLLVVSRLDCFFISRDLLLKVLLVSSGIAVEVTTLIVVVFLNVDECGRALSDSLEAGQARHVSVCVNVEVLDRGWLCDILISLLVLDFLVVYFQLLLILLDAHFDAVHKHLIVFGLLGGQRNRGLLVSKASDRCCHLSSAAV